MKNGKVREERKGAQCQRIQVQNVPIKKIASFPGVIAALVYINDAKNMVELINARFLAAQKIAKVVDFALRMVEDPDAKSMAVHAHHSQKAYANHTAEGKIVL